MWHSRKHSPLEPGVSARRWIGRLRLHAGKYILGLTAPTGTGVQALVSSYIGQHVVRVRNSLGRQAGAHELKHDGYRLQIHIRDGRVRLYTMNAADWSDRYRLIAEEAGRSKPLQCGMPDFDRLHSRFFDQVAVACAFDLLMLSGDDLRRKPFAEREAALRKLLKHEPDGIQYVEHTEGDGGACSMRSGGSDWRASCLNG
jgi:ATP-dependent DNA ligase